MMLVQVTPQLDPAQLDGGGAWQLHAASLPLEHRDADADADADAAGMGAGTGAGVGASSLAEYMQLCMLRSLGRLVLQHALQLQTKGRLAALQAADPLHLPIASGLQRQAAQLRATGSLQAADALALQAAQLQAAAARGVAAARMDPADLPSDLPSERELVAALSDALLPSVPCLCPHWLGLGASL